MYLEEFKNELLKQDKSVNTADGYPRDVREFIRFYEGSTGEGFSPEDIIELDINTFKSYLKNIKRENPRTINRKLSALKKYFNFIVAKNIIENNPASNVKLMEYQRRRAVDIIEDNDLYRVRRKIYSEDNKRDIAIFEVFNNTGVRVSELCNIHIEDVKFTEGLKKANLVVYSGKGGKYREIPLNNDARKAILEYLEVRPTTSEPFLFIGERGPLTRNGVNRILNKYAYNAKIEKLHPHMLRHKFAHNLIREGVPESTVGELLGHDDPNSTRVYTSPTQKDKEKAVESISSLD